MLLNFDRPLLNIDGSDAKATMATSLANFLGSETKDPIKLYGWVQKLNKEKILDLDSADYKKLYELIENSDRFMVITKGQILEYMDSVKNAPTTTTPQSE